MFASKPGLRTPDPHPGLVPLLADSFPLGLWAPFGATRSDWVKAQGGREGSPGPGAPPLLPAWHPRSLSACVC